MDGDVLPTSPSRAPTAQSPPVTHTLDSCPNTQVPHNLRGLTRTASTRSRVANNMDARAVDNCCPTLPKRIIEQPARALGVFGAGNGGDWPALQPAAVAVSPWPRSPPPPSSQTYTHLNPRGAAAHPCSGDLSQPYKQNPAAEETDGGAQVCVCVFLLLPSVFPVGNYLLFHGKLRGGGVLVVAPEDTCPREIDRRCALPLGCGFCGIPKRVEPVR